MGWFSGFLQTLPFANSAMLLWGLAASVPIIIHLWSKRRYNRVAWAAMEFLLAAVRKNSRRIRIEQLILLLLRVAILILLAVALADPVWSLFASLGSPLAGRGSTHHVLVLDASYSMGYRAAERSRFEVARQLAAQVVTDSRQGDGFTLVLMADPPVTVIGDPAFSPGDALDELQNVRLRHTGANLTTTLGDVETILRRAKEKHERLKSSKVFFFTDLGRTTWDEAAGDECRRRLARLSEQATLILIDVGQSDVQNLAVTNLLVREPLVTAGQRVRIEAEIENFGTRDQSGRQAALYADDQQVLVEKINVPASGRAAVSFVHRFESPGEHQIEVRLEDDPLDVDNHRWASVPVRDAIRVLCVEGRPGEAQHVALALEPSLAAQPRVQVQTQFENVLLESDLLQYDAIFLCNLARFGRDEAVVLHDYVRNGGGLIVTLGDQVQAENYNAMLGNAASARVLPARLDAVAAEGDYLFDPLDYQHPIVAPFSGHVRAGLLTTPVWRYFRVAPFDDSSARVALAFNNGDAAIVESRLQSGVCILVTTATSPLSVDRSTSPPTPWSALSTWPSFPPLIQEILAFAARGRAESRNRQVGEPLEGAVRGTFANLNVTVERPDGSSERVPVQVDGADSRWVVADTTRSGIHTARYDAPVNRHELFAVNVNPRESNLQRLDPDLLPSQLTLGLQTDEPAAMLPMTQPARYFRHLLGLLLVLLLVESSWAWYIGNASA
ncbi:MAG: BatA domain-containing protein [Pirellulaceae bacterium]|nr:BatA domain-containing protein [Pirellulaceae bacterium]